MYYHIVTAHSEKELSSKVNSVLNNGVSGECIGEQS